MPDGAVYVGRGSTFGNPYSTGNRQGDVDAFHFSLAKPSTAGGRRLYFEEMRKALPRLHGKDLVCWCHDWDGQGTNPMYCHADILLKWANPEVRGGMGPDPFQEVLAACGASLRCLDDGDSVAAAAPLRRVVDLYGERQSR